MLEIKNISVKLGQFSLNNISFSVEKGDYLTVLGLSGAGKTVLLEVLAGLVKPDNGTLMLEDKDITHMSIQKRPLGLVYQDMALFPHLSVKQNIAYPLKRQGLSRPEIKQRVAALAEQTRIPHLLHRQPATLSGGEAQRVALARTLAAEPRVLLLDEPLASLDIKLRQELRQLLKEINQQGKTIIHVTHDYMEAATLSKNIAIIENGNLLQWGKPAEVFRNPVSEFVARFSGIKNIFLCQFEETLSNNGTFAGKTPKGTIIRMLEPPGRKEMHIMIPGEDIILSDQHLETSAINQFQGHVKEILILNHGMEIIVSAGDDFSVIITKSSFDHMHLTNGKQIWISFKASAVKAL